MKFNYKKSINIKNNQLLLDKVNELIELENNSEFNYLSLSIRNHKINLATSIPSNKIIVEHYVKKNLIEIDPLSCFECFTKKSIVTYSEIKRYKNHGKCGSSFMKEREKIGIVNGFNYIYRTRNWAFTVVFGTDFKKNGFAVEECLIEKNTYWINKIIRQSIFLLNESKYNIFGLKKKKFDFTMRLKKKKLNYLYDKFNVKKNSTYHII